VNAGVGTKVCYRQKHLGNKEEGKMQQTNIFKYYRFGYNYFVLRFETEGKIIAGQHSNSLAGLIDGFFEFLEELNLPVTKNAGSDLTQIRKEINDIPKEQEVDKELARRVQEACDALDRTLDSELRLKNAFVVTPKRFQLEHLLVSPNSLFGAQVFEKLPTICQFDFAEGCRCIAFGLSTAAAFHVMRGTEGTLRYYYCAIVKRGRVKRMMWHDVVTHLRQRRDPPPKALLDNLDNIRVNFRNPTQHPDARYDIDEAQDLLLISIDAVNRMIRGLPKTTA
jgi:hypothetical protein